jgi:hypothetical protein
MRSLYQNPAQQRPSYVRTLTRAIQRHTRHSVSALNPDPSNSGWVNDEEFEILESGIVADETPDPSWSRRHKIRH